MSPGLLGPERPADAAALRRELRDLARGLVDGARHLRARRTPARALGVMAVHRFLYGVVFIAAILMSRNLLAAPGTDGLAVFGTVLAVLGIGSAVAVVLTPVLAPRTGPHAWIVLCLLLAAAGQLVLAASDALPAVLLVAGLIGLAAQGAKIAIDTIVQRDTDDAYRGRAFALYDVLYNAAFVGAAALAALVLPDTGHSPAVFAGLAVVYLATAVAYRAAARRGGVVGPAAPPAPARPSPAGADRLSPPGRPRSRRPDAPGSSLTVTISHSASGPGTTRNSGCGSGTATSFQTANTSGLRTASFARRCSHS